MSSTSSLEEGEIREEGEICSTPEDEASDQQHRFLNGSHSHSTNRLLRDVSSTRVGVVGPSGRGRSVTTKQSNVADIIDDIHYDTKFVGLQDCIKNLQGVCYSLHRAIQKAVRLHDIFAQTQRGEVQQPQLLDSMAAVSQRILHGLRSLHVLSNTGQGRNMEQAREAVKAAWENRNVIFSAAQQKQFESWLQNSKRLAALLPRDTELYEPAHPSQTPSQPWLPARKQRLPKTQSTNGYLLSVVPPPPPPPSQFQPATTSVGDKRPNAAVGDSSTSSGSSKRSRQGPSQQKHQHTRQADAVCEDGELPDLQPQSPPLVLHEGDTSSMELADSGGAATTVQQVVYRLQDTAGSASAQHSSPQPLAAPVTVPPAPPPRVSQFHGVDISEDVRGLLGRGKLCLVLDLDHTLLNSVRFAEVEPALAQRLEWRRAKEVEAVPEQDRLLFRMDDIKMWTKLRPRVRSFLETAAQSFELWIHTNGNKTYAAAVTKLLDPTGALFGERVIAQGAERFEEMQANQAKSFMQGLEGREAVTVVLDDSHSVWAQHKRNLVVVERYVYFPSSRLQLGMRGSSLLEANRDECAEQGMLSTALDVLQRVHQRVFEAVAASPSRLPNGKVFHPVWDVRHALGEERLRVLRGVVLVFSRVFPLDQRPESHQLWQMAEACGARCSTLMDDTVTHLVAAAGGTEKVALARQRGVHVVTPGWLECSCILWKRAQEERFPVLN